MLFGPAKAANAGGVACSALEMTQNSMRYAWTFEGSGCQIKSHHEKHLPKVSEAAQAYSHPDNLVAGANIAGFIRVAEAMLAQGVV